MLRQFLLVSASPNDGGNRPVQDGAQDLGEAGVSEGFEFMRSTQPSGTWDVPRVLGAGVFPTRTFFMRPSCSSTLGKRCWLHRRVLWNPDAGGRKAALVE